MIKPVWNKDYKEPAGWNDVTIGSNHGVGILPTVNSGFRTLTPKIENTNCIKCMLCWVFCPEGCIDKTGEALKIDLDYCKGCGICAEECPKKCIEMVKE